VKFALLALLVTTSVMASAMTEPRYVVVVFKHSSVVCLYERREDSSYRMVANCSLIGADFAFSKEDFGDGRIPEGVFIGTFDGSEFYFEDPEFGMEKVYFRPSHTDTLFTGEVAICSGHYDELLGFFSYLKVIRMKVIVIPARLNGSTAAEMGLEPDPLTDAMDSLGLKFKDLVLRIREDGVLPTVEEFEAARNGYGVFGMGLRSLYSAPTRETETNDRASSKSDRI
jgi:hypothetical protein